MQISCVAPKQSTMVGQAKLQSPEHDSIKLVDDKMNWWDSVIEYLLDQTQMSVVYVLNLQKTVKTMVMSLLLACLSLGDFKGKHFP